MSDDGSPGVDGPAAGQAPPGRLLGGLAVAWLAGFVAQIAALSVMCATAGGADCPADLELRLLGLASIPLWAGFTGGALWLARRSGGVGVLRWRGAPPRPVVVAAVVGLVTQVVVIPLLYLPVVVLFPDVDVGAPARELTERAAGDPVGVAVLAVMTAVGAPVFEELFFRGALLGVLERRHRPRVALVIQAVVFALLHFQPVQTPALVVVGLVTGYAAQRTGSLVPAIAAHAGFNTVALASLLL